MIALIGIVSFSMALTTRTGAIRTGTSMLSKPLSLTSDDGISQDDTVNITIQNPQRYMQFQTFTTSLTNISGTTSVTVTAYGKITSAGDYVQIGSPVTVTTSAVATITATTPINYNFLKLEYIAGSGTQHSHIATFDVRTANAFDIPANSGTFTISRATSGAVIVTSKDNDANAATTYRAGGTGALTIGNAAGTTAITSSDWAIDATGAMTGIGAISSNGLIATSAAATVGTTLGVTGVSTLTGGYIIPTPSPVIWAKGGSTVLATSGTDVACADGTRFWVEVDIPYNVTLTGLAYLIGSAGTTDSVVVQLCNSAGVQVATSRAIGTAAAIVGTAATFQSCAFSATYAAVAGKYFAVVQFNGTNAKFRAYPIPGSKFITGTVAGTWGTKADITPGTSFAADKGPIVMTY